MAESVMVLCARRLTWSQEFAVTSLAARMSVSPFGKLHHHQPLLRLLPPPCRWEFHFQRRLLCLEVAPHVPRRRSSSRSLRITHPHAAGIDIHSSVHWVAVPPGDAPPATAGHSSQLPSHVRSFGTCTADLADLADWLGAMPYSDCGHGVNGSLLDSSLRIA